MTCSPSLQFSATELRSASFSFYLKTPRSEINYIKAKSFLDIYCPDSEQRTFLCRAAEVALFIVNLWAGVAHCIHFVCVGWPVVLIHFLWTLPACNRSLPLFFSFSLSLSSPFVPCCPSVLHVCVLCEFSLCPCLDPVVPVFPPQLFIPTNQPTPASVLLFHPLRTMSLVSCVFVPVSCHLL